MAAVRTTTNVKFVQKYMIAYLQTSHEILFYTLNFTIIAAMQTFRVLLGTVRQCIFNFFFFFLSLYGSGLLA